MKKCFIIALLCSSAALNAEMIEVKKGKEKKINFTYNPSTGEAYSVTHSSTPNTEVEVKCNYAKRPSASKLAPMTMPGQPIACHIEFEGKNVGSETTVTLAKTRLGKPESTKTYTFKVIK